jgi:hypothetical protein
MLEEYENAVEDYGRATDLEPHSEAYDRGLKTAKLELKKSKRKNYYKVRRLAAHCVLLWLVFRRSLSQILECAKDATQTEIKKAYRKAVRSPRHRHRSPPHRHHSPLHRHRFPRHRHHSTPHRHRSPRKHHRSPPHRHGAGAEGADVVQALKWHPDKVMSGVEEEVAKSEAMFKDVGEAYAVLSDEQKKARYDGGVRRRRRRPPCFVGRGHGSILAIFDSLR